MGLGNLKLSHKLIVGSALLAIIPVVIASMFIGYVSNETAREALENQARNQLVSVRDIKKSQIEGYFNTIRDQVLTFSNDRMIIDYMRQVKPAFKEFQQQALDEDISVYRSKLSQYYSQDFEAEFGNQNQGERANASTWLNQLDAESVALQYQYIKANPNPLGSKDGLEDPKDGSAYSALHATYHPHIRDFLNKFEYYDVFMVDPETGDIVYSVFKELDYTTSLIDGPYANTGIGEVFRKANAATSADSFAVADFAPYAPSYNGAASFIASPIFDGGEKVGVLIFQMPVDRINEVMTHGEKWKEGGLGDSGETYLVGSDFKMRSQSRFLIEDMAGYLAAIKAGGASQRTVDLINAKGTALGLATVQSIATKAAIGGETGYQIIPDYRGVSVLSAYTPVDILGMKWALMAEIDEAEAFRAVHELANKINTSAVGVSVVMAILAVLLGWLFSRTITRPIIESVALADRIADGDLTHDIVVRSKDEIGQLQLALKTMNEKLYGIVSQVRTGADSVGSAASEISTGNTDLSQRTEEQASSLEETASSMEEMTSTVNQNADNARQANQLGVVSRELAEKGGEVVGKAVEAMSEINASSKKIADIIGVIDEIAFQTNLLALNAAVEAARAGEQGRGFAVVAGEVRTLAQRSAEAAKEIKDLIKDSVQKVEHGSSLVDEAGNTLKEIVDSVRKVTDIMSEIAAASTEQATGIEQVNKAVTQMDDMTQQNAALVEEAAAASKAMEEQAASLRAQMDFFKLNSSEQRSVVRAPVAEPEPIKAPVPKLAPLQQAKARTGTSDSEWEEF